MANATISALVMSLVVLLAACKPEVQQAPRSFPSAWDTEAVSKGTSYENRIAWARAESGHPKERLLLDTRVPEGRPQSESWPVLRMSKPYGCEVNDIDVAVDSQRFDVEIWDHYTDVIIAPGFESERISGSNANRDVLFNAWDSAPFWQAFRAGDKIAFRLEWNCDYPQASPARNETLVTFSLMGADYALDYVTRGPS